MAAAGSCVTISSNTGFTEIVLKNGPLSANQSLQASLLSIDEMATQLMVVAPTYYTKGVLINMTANDMIFALRSALDFANI